jgi:hypothetical protein
VLRSHGLFRAAEAWSEARPAGDRR